MAIPACDKEMTQVQGQYKHMVNWISEDRTDISSCTFIKLQVTLAHFAEYFTGSTFPA